MKSEEKFEECEDEREKVLKYLRQNYIFRKFLAFFKIYFEDEFKHNLIFKRFNFKV